MGFEPSAYSPEVARILSIEEGGNRLMPLIAHPAQGAAARRAIGSRTAKELFAGSAAPNAALAGLWLYFSCFEEAHQLAQDDNSANGSLWHAILHRQEPDYGNSAYWFRKTGQHPVYPKLVEETAQIVRRYPQAEFRPSVEWDPYGFILLCERAVQQPGSPSEAAALEIQRAEWQLLFDHCARPKK